MRLSFAVLGTVLLALLAATGLRDTQHEWKATQKHYKQAVSELVKDARVLEAVRAEPIAISQMILPGLGRVDRCMTCHVGVENPAMVGQPPPLGAHPGDILTNHPSDVYGCTICHAGQGLATAREAGHARNYDGWGYPLLTEVTLGSSCVRCHRGQLPKAAGLAVKGRELFLSNGCKGCHQVDGRGGILGPALSDIGEASIHVKHPSESGLDDYLERARGDYNFAYLLEAIENPSADSSDTAMPDFGFEADSVEAVAVYVKGLRSLTLPATYTVSEVQGGPDGASLFAEFCSACHGKAGEGGLSVGRMGPSLNNQDFLSVAARSFVGGVITNGRRGFDKVMPAWKAGVGGLEAREIEALTDHILSFKQPPPSFDAVLDAKGSAAAGERVYSQRCSTCHGEQLEGGIGPSLKTTTFLQLSDTQYLYEAIAHGRPGAAMPSWQALTAQEIQSLILFIESRIEVQATVAAVVQQQGDASAGARRYRRRCSACHGSEGIGRTAPALNSPEFLAAADDRYLARVVVEGRKQAGMPSWSHLSVEELANIIAYVRSLGPLVANRVRPGKGDALNGGRIYTRACSSCHGERGGGGSGPAIGAAGFLDQADAALIKTIMAYPAAKTGSVEALAASPHAQLNLPDSQMDDVVAYLQSLVETPVRALRGSKGSAGRGEQAYQRVCASCHGLRAHGGSGPALANPQFLASASDGYLAGVAVLGRPGTAMLAVVSDTPGSKAVTPEELVDIIAYLRGESLNYWDQELQTLRTITGKASHGEQVYRDICHKCHGEAGGGSAKAPALNDPTFLSNATDGYLAATIVLGRRGTIMHSKTKEGAGLAKLKSSDIPDLVEYLRSFSEESHD